MNNRRCPKRVPVVKIKPHETQEKHRRLIQYRQYFHLRVLYSSLWAG